MNLSFLPSLSVYYEVLPGCDSLISEMCVLLSSEMDETSLRLCDNWCYDNSFLICLVAIFFLQVFANT